MANQKQIQIKASDDVLKGAYSNLAQVSHLKEEFVLDYMNVFPHQGIGVLTSRVIISPQHYKRMVAAMQENLKRYEQTHGIIDVSEQPQHEIGFQG